MARGSEARLVDKIVHEAASPAFASAVFVNAVLNTHPTHQQAIMRNLVQPLVNGWAESYALGLCDLRREGTGQIASAWQQATPSGIYLPYV